MSEYHVGLPNKMMLTVEIEDTPITMHITFPQGRRVTFHYKGNPERTASVTESQGPKPAPIPDTHPRKGAAAATLGPLQKRSISDSDPQTGNLQIEFVDPAGSEM